MEGMKGSLQLGLEEMGVRARWQSRPVPFRTATGIDESGYAERGGAFTFYRLLTRRKPEIFTFPLLILLPDDRISPHRQVSPPLVGCEPYCDHESKWENGHQRSLACGDSSWHLSIGAGLRQHYYDIASSIASAQSLQALSSTKISRRRRQFFKSSSAIS